MLQSLYNKLPIWMQNLALSAYGVILYNQRYGGVYNRALKEAKQVEQMDLQQINALENQKFKRIVHYAYEHVPFYKKLYDEHGVNIHEIQGINDSIKLPVLTKEMIRANLELMISNEFNEKNLIKQSTGGSTGDPLHLFISKEEMQYNSALYEARIKNEFGLKTGDRLATFLGRKVIGGTPNKNIFWRNNHRYNQRLYSTYHMTRDNMMFYYEDLKLYKPQMMIGYVTPIYQLAKFINDQKLEPLHIHGVFVSSESLHKEQRHEIEKAFTCRISDGYSQAECVAFITECREGKLHTQPDYGYCEYVKVENSPYHEVLGTSYFRFAMPLIRYQTKDLVLLSQDEKCACGKCFMPIVKEIIGRDESVIETSEGRYISSAALSLVMKHYPLLNVQLIQRDLYHYEVLAVVNQMNWSHEASFIAELKETVDENATFSVRYVDELPRTSSGKTKMLIKMMS